MMGSEQESNKNPDDVFNILVATDIHLGYAEKDVIRGDDSFNTFEEILQIADQRQVDFVLLGGDLFHDNKPTPLCIHRCLTLLRRYCMGDRPVVVEFLSDQAENFQHCMNPIVNYEDPNYNISIPVYSIHGNHDDPSGYGRVATLDLLSASGLINYFGKCTDLTQININPILLQKGSSKLAIYGLSYIKDERLSRLFRDRKVTMLRPKEFPEDWFNVLVLHQNRVMRGPNNYLPEEALDEFLDLVIWGHEHECRIEPELNVKNGVYVIQPGSPVATSLCEGESVEKFVTILKIHKKEFISEKIKLRTVRPFVMDSLILSNCTLNRIGGALNEEIQLYLTERVEDLIRRSQELLTGHKKQPILPLIRLRVEYSDEMEYFNPIRFGQQFTERVANPIDMILLKRERKERKIKSEDPLDREAMENVLGNEEDEGDDWGNRAEMVVEKYFTEGDAKQLRVLSVRGLAEAVKRFIDKGDTDAIGDITRYQIKKTVKYIHDKKIVADEDTVSQEMENFQMYRLQRSDEDTREAETVLDSKTRTVLHATADTGISQDSDSDNEMINGTAPVQAPSTTRGRRGQSRGRGRGVSRGVVVGSSDSTPARGRGARGARGAAGTKNIKEALSVQRTTPRTRTSKVMYISDSD